MERVQFFLVFVLVLGISTFSSSAQNVFESPVIDLPKIIIGYSITGDNITFDIVAETTGYVGIGLSNNTGMTNADIFIGGVHPDGSLYFGDYTSTAPGMPILDDEQNWELVSGVEEDGMTTLTVTRGLDTGDIKDVQITNRSISFIWATGETDELLHHGVDNKGQVFHNFLIDLPSTTEPPSTTTPPTTTQKPVTIIIIDTEVFFLSYTITQKDVTFDVFARTVGYVGFGFSNSSGMTNSDIFMGGVFPNGTTYSGDYTSRSAGMPTLDQEQNWMLDFGVESAGTTTLKFSRELNTGDPVDIVIEDRMMTLIWAFGLTDELQYHGIDNKGQVLFNLVTGSPPSE